MLSNGENVPDSSVKMGRSATRPTGHVRGRGSVSSPPASHNFWATSRWQRTSSDHKDGRPSEVGWDLQSRDHSTREVGIPIGLGQL